MSFVQLPTPGRRNVTPAISPAVMPQMETAQVSNKAQIRTSNANMNESTSSKTSGRSIGGKTKGRNKTKKPSTPVVPFVRNKSNDNSVAKSALTLNQSDFGFDIGGSNTPTQFAGSRDNTLFRDYNQLSVITDYPKKVRNNDISNQIKSFDTGFESSLATSTAYFGSWSVDYNKIYREIVAKTRGAKGALDAIASAGLQSYLNFVLDAYDTLIELETIQAWDPSSTSEYDRSLRNLASLASTPEILELRTNLRQALIPHVLPLGWMKYIKWLRQTHLASPASESTKLRFCSSNTVKLMNQLTQGTSIQEWTDHVNVLVADLQNQDPRLPAILMANVECIPFGNVKDHYSNVYKSAVYDNEYCNVFDNRTIQWSVNGEDVFQYPNLLNTARAEAAFSTMEPYSIALASLVHQYSQSSGLPLEGEIRPVKVDNQSIMNTVFYLTEEADNAGVFKLRGVEHWYEGKSNSTHMIDLDESGALTSYVTVPRASNTMMFVAAKSNCEMAQRESLSNITANS